MHTVIPARLISQEEWRGLGLSVATAYGRKLALGLGKSDLHPHRRHPFVSDRRDPRIQPFAQFGDDRWKRVGKVLVFAEPETKACHIDTAAKAFAHFIHRAQRRTFGRR